MLTNHAQSAIVERWQQEIEASLEAGDPPLLAIGLGAGMFDGVVGYGAYLTWVAERNDVTTPQIVSGGPDPTWLAVWLTPPTAAPSASEPELLFCGPDRATLLASTNMQAHQKQSAHGRPTSDLPAGAVPLFAPHVHPGTSAPLEALPWHAASEESVSSPNSWVSWAAILCAVALIFGALLF